MAKEGGRGMSKSVEETIADLQEGINLFEKLIEKAKEEQRRHHSVNPKASIEP